MESVTQNTNDRAVKKGHAAKKLLLICLRKILNGDNDLKALSNSSSSGLFYKLG